MAPIEIVIRLELGEATRGWLAAVLEGVARQAGVAVTHGAVHQVAVPHVAPAPADEAATVSEPVGAKAANWRPIPETKWTEERLALARQIYPGRMPKDEVLERINALPGAPIASVDAMEHKLRFRNIKRKPEALHTTQPSIVSGTYYHPRTVAAPSPHDPAMTQQATPTAPRPKRVLSEDRKAQLGQIAANMRAAKQAKRAASDQGVPAAEETPPVAPEPETPAAVQDIAPAAPAPIAAAMPRPVQRPVMVPSAPKPVVDGSKLPPVVWPWGNIVQWAAEHGIQFTGNLIPVNEKRNALGLPAIWLEVPQIRKGGSA